jgi:2-keto-3-deoxy-6-phosphogluconate aldolase
MQGATGVVVNAPTAPEVIEQIAENVDIPIVVTVTRWDDMIHDQVKAGAAILNVAAASGTPEIVACLRREYPDMPIIASGGPTDETILQTISAGANAISWTPPSNKEVFSDIMAAYRDGKGHP